MANIYDMADTWNDAGTTYTGIKLNVTDTASAAASLLMDLQVGGVSKFSVSKAGGVIADTAKVGDAGSYLFNNRNVLSSPESKVLKSTQWEGGAASLQLGQLTVATLPSAAAYPGTLAFVSDATATTARSTVAGGGANKVLVMSDGTNWLIVA